MRRPPIKALLVIGLMAASSPMIFRSCSETSQTAATNPPKTTQAAASNGKTAASLASRQPTNAGTTNQPKTQVVASTPAQQNTALTHAPDAAKISASPAAKATIQIPDRAASPAPSRPETAAAGNQLPLPAIQLADDVRLPAALLPHDTANESPVITAARTAIGDRFYRTLQETAAKDPAVNSTSGADDTVIIHQSATTENALKRANEEYRALFGDAAFNQKTIDTHIEVKQPPLEDTPSAGSSH